MSKAGSHYFDERPSGPSDQRTVQLQLPDMSLDLLTDRGVFSAEGVDKGTAILLADAPAPPPSGEILDLGCGYGPIALAVAKRAPGAGVWAVDVNERALELAGRNAKALGLGNVRVCRPEDVPEDLRFSAIYSNPPVRIGKAALHAMLIQWLDRLAPDGRAHLVVQRHLGSDTLARWLGEQGFTVRRLGSKNAYRILEVGSRAGQ